MRPLVFLHFISPGPGGHFKINELSGLSCKFVHRAVTQNNIFYYFAHRPWDERESFSEASTNFNNSFSDEKDGNAAHDNTLALNHLERSEAQVCLYFFYKMILSMTHNACYCFSCYDMGNGNLPLFSPLAKNFAMF